MQRSQHRSTRAIAAILVLPMTLTGCATYQENQKAILAAGGAGLAVGGACLLARGNPALCALLAVAGAAAGGVIGHHLDERDKQRRAEALALAFNTPSVWTPAPPSDAEGAPDAPGAAPRLKPRHRLAPRSVAHAPDKPWVDPDTQVVAWVNPDTQNSGTIAPVRTYAAKTGRACHEYKETYVRDGQTFTDSQKACQQPDGSWS